MNFEEEKRHNYEYEPYMKDSLEDNIEGAVNNRGNGLHDNDYYNESTDDYSYSDDDYYGENEAELYYNDPDIQDSKFEENDIGTQTKDFFLFATPTQKNFLYFFIFPIDKTYKFSV